MKKSPIRSVTRVLPSRALIASSLLLAGLLGASQAEAGIVPNGVNLQPSYYNNGNVNFGWSLMNANTKIQTVRIEIEPDKVSQAKSWISQAKANGKTIIATYHKSAVLGSDSVTELSAGGTWWKTNYSQLSASGAFTLNLMNEWGSHNISASSFASAYNTAISTVRQVYAGRIIIDASGWGQETAVMACALKGCNAGTKISDTNVAASIHVYPGAWNQAKNRWLDTTDLDDMASGGRPCIVGEFGTGSGSADWAGITDAARTKGWSVIGWAWNGDGGSLNMVTPSWSTNATATSFATSSYFSSIYNHI